MKHSGACVDWVDCCFCRGHAENQPAVPDIDRRKSKNVAKEAPIRLGISAVKQKMAPKIMRQSIYALRSWV